MPRNRVARPAAIALTLALGLAALIASAPAAAQEPAGYEGLGIMLRFKPDEGDEYPVVIGIVETGAAGKDGRLKMDDVVIGVEEADGKVVEFKDMPFEEMVKMLRGPSGTKVKLVVKPKDEEKRKTYELTRAKVEVPNP